MDILLKDKNKIINIVDKLKKEKPEGSTRFFDKIDEILRDPKNVDMIYHLINKIKIDFGQNFNLIITGKFGDFIFSLIKIGKIKIRGIVIHVSGSLRTSIKGKSFQIINGDENRIFNNNFILLDDSYYSGSTKKEIDKNLKKYNAKIIKTYVFYDGSFIKDKNVYSLYRYYDYHKDNILPIKKLISVLNSVEENIPYDIIENKIMKGKIRNIKELLNEISHLKNKFKLNKNYDYHRVYDNKNNDEKYYTFDDLIFKTYNDGKSGVDLAELNFSNGIDLKVYRIKMLNNSHKYLFCFYRNNRKIYEIIINHTINPYTGYKSKKNIDAINDLLINYQKIKKNPLDPYDEEVWENYKHLNEKKRGYYTFDDLVFKKEFGFNNSKRAEIIFNNGYKISVLFGKYFYSNGIDTYEVAIFNPQKRFALDVLSHITKDEITEIMIQYQNVGKIVSDIDPYGEEVWLNENKEYYFTFDDLEFKKKSWNGLCYNRI